MLAWRVAAVAEAAVALALIITSDRESQKAATAALAFTAGVSFIAAGLIALYRRPENRTGVYLASVGYLWFLAALTEANNDVVFTLGVWLGNLAFVPFAALVLAFPTGRLAPRPDRLLVRHDRLRADRARRSCSCSRSSDTAARRVREQRGRRRRVADDGDGRRLGRHRDHRRHHRGGGAVLVRRWRATPALRRMLAPVYLAGGAALVVLLLSNVLSQVSRGAADASRPCSSSLRHGAVRVPLGIMRSRLARGWVVGLVVSIGQGMPCARDRGRARRSDARARLLARGGSAFRRPRRSQVRPARARLGPGRVGRRAGRRPVGAIVHDESLVRRARVVESVSAGGCARARQRAARGRAGGAVRLPDHDRRHGPSLLVRIDVDGVIRNINPATVAASGLASDEEGRGRYFWDVFIDDAEREAMVGASMPPPGFAPPSIENDFSNARGEPAA